MTGILVRPSRNELRAALETFAPWRPPQLYDSPLEQRDFERRFLEAERIKRQMRARYAQAVRETIGESAAAFRTRSREFWSHYQAVNDDLIPEDPVYSGSIAAHTMATTADNWTLTSPASGQARVLEAFLSGEAGASAVARVALQRSTGGATPVNQTPEKFSTRSPAAAGTFATGWTTQPTLSGNPFAFQGFNAFGGADRWVPQPGEEFYLVNGELMSNRSASGTSVVSGHVVFEEL